MQMEAVVDVTPLQGQGQEQGQEQAHEQVHEQGQGQVQGQVQVQGQGQGHEQERALLQGAGGRPLPERILQATQMHGRNGELVVLPDVRPQLLAKVEAFGFNPEDVGSLLDAGAVCAGSFLVHHCMDRAQWDPGDLDLFGPASALELAKRRLGKPDDDDDEKRRLDARYLHSTTVRGEQVIEEVATWTSAKGTKLQFICVSCAPEEAVRQFDLPLVQAWSDGKFIFVPAATHRAMLDRASPLLVPTSVDGEGIECTDNTVIARRLARACKYAARGFAIQLPSTIVAASVPQWDLLLHTCDPALRTVLDTTYALPHGARAAWRKYSDALKVHMSDLKRAWAQDPELRTSFPNLHALAAARPLARPTCTVVRRPDREWLTRDDVIATNTRTARAAGATC